MRTLLQRYRWDVHLAAETTVRAAVIGKNSSIPSDQSELRIHQHWVINQLTGLHHFPFTGNFQSSSIWGFKLRALSFESLRSNLKPFTHQHPSLAHIWHVLAPRAEVKRLFFVPCFQRRPRPSLRAVMLNLVTRSICAFSDHSSSRHIWLMAAEPMGSEGRGRDGERHLSAHAELVRCGLAPSSHGSTRATRCTRRPAHEKGHGAQSSPFVFTYKIQCAVWHRPQERFRLPSYRWSSHTRN